MYSFVCFEQWIASCLFSLRLGRCLFLCLLCLFSWLRSVFVGSCLCSVDFACRLVAARCQCFGLIPLHNAFLCFQCCDVLVTFACVVSVVLRSRIS